MIDVSDEKLAEWLKRLMEETQWKSFVLQCDPGDDDCKVCDFLAGKRDLDTMMHVIKVLDHELAAEKKHSHKLTLMIVDQCEKISKQLEM